MIRPARPADAAAIATIHARARAGWTTFVDPARLMQTGEGLWTERLASDEVETRVLERDGVVAGFVSLGPAGDDDLAGEPVGEMRALYVDPDAQRRGVATALVADAVAWARARGHELLVLWTLAGNAEGRAYYAATGWTCEEDTQQFDPDFGVDEIRYRLPL